MADNADERIAAQPRPHTDERITAQPRRHTVNRPSTGRQVTAMLLVIVGLLIVFVYGNVFCAEASRLANASLSTGLFLIEELIRWLWPLLAIIGFGVVLIVLGCYLCPPWPPRRR